MKTLRPIYEEWFEVDASTIDITLFQKERADIDQENTRKLILKAFDQMKNEPEKYGKFRTLMPSQEWYPTKLCCEIAAMKDFVREKGGEMATWIHQALEWAQRIANGDSWEAICNEADTVYWYRAVIWDNGFVRIVGGSIYDEPVKSASHVNYRNYGDGAFFENVVPLIAQHCS